MNACDNDGWTPLHAAAHWAQDEACKLLAQHRANVSATDHVVCTVITLLTVRDVVSVETFLSRDVLTSRLGQNRQRLGLGLVSEQYVLVSA